MSMILHRCNAARAWHHMMLTGALEYENLSVIGMVNKTLVLCQTDGLTAVQSGAQLPSCQQCCIHILFCRKTAADFRLVAVLVKVPRVCKGRRSYLACCPAGATQQVMQKLQRSTTSAAQLSTAIVMFRLSTYHVAMSCMLCTCMSS